MPDDPSRIRVLRLEAGIRVAALAKAIDYSAEHLSRVEAGKVPVTEVLAVRVARELSKALGREVRPTELLPDPEPPEGESSPSTPPVAQALQHCVA